MKRLLPNEDSSDDSDSERPAVALKSLRIFALRTKDAPVDTEHDHMHGALRYDGDDHDDHVMNPSATLVAPTIVTAIDDAMDRERALGALDG